MKREKDKKNNKTAGEEMGIDKMVDRIYRQEQG